jgi:hypothetical protein
MGKLLKLIILLLPFMAGFYGCVSSSNFYTGKTLDEKKFAVTVGFEDIVLKSADKSLTISKDAPFFPSLGFAYGLPLKFEPSIRYIPSRMVELAMRKQLTSDSSAYDFSLNFTYGHLFGGYSYLKYGATISKDIHGFEPYLHYTFYSFTGATEGDFSDSFLSGAVTSFINNCRVVGFGIGVPWKKIKLFPEADYQYNKDSFSGGIWHVGVGFRLYTN